ncbi:MAG: PaaI family thioesterase [Desulfatibacillum sp.]|nr:PaaI family thioesterase [Desulfatibacillum sp.]
MLAFSKTDLFAAHCGCELLDAGDGRAKARMVLVKEHLNGAGVVHGGAIFTLADFAFAMASNSHGTLALAINVSVSFMKAIKTGELTAEVEEISRNPKLATYAMRVTDESGDLIASLQGTVYRKKDRLPEGQA